MLERLLRPIGLLIMLSALALALVRAPDRPVESLVAQWAPPPSDFLELRGQLVHLRDEGPRTDAVPIVLLHGTASSLHTWQGWAAALRTQRRVITLDLPGFGLTGPFTGGHDPDDYRADTYARFVLELLDALKLGRVALGGNSFGGEIAWRVASLAPERVERLILVDATGYDIAPQSVPLGFRLARVPVLRTLGRWVLPRALVEQGLKSVYGDPARVQPALVDRYFDLLLRTGNREALVQRLAQLAPGEGIDRLAKLKLPVLILWGGRDRLVPPAAAQRFHADIPGSRVVVFDGLGHLPQEEDPAATLTEMQKFLAGT